ncbi:MAG: phosphoenolpyruvate--protein phosphotransferase [Gammaproteobacteria bacterium]
MLEILRKLIQEINHAPDLTTALNVIVHRIRTVIDADAVSVYYRDIKQQQLILMATDGLNPASVGQVSFGYTEGLVGRVFSRAELLNLEDAVKHPDYRFKVETSEQTFHGFLGVPMIQHRDVLGVLVVRQEKAKLFSAEEETLLMTLAAQLAGAISHAELRGEATLVLTSQQPSAFKMTGVSGSAGFAIGEAVVVYPHANLSAVPDQKISGSDIVHQIEIFESAIDAVENDIREFSRKMNPSLTSENTALFDAFLLMLRSDSIVQKTIEHIQAGNWAQGALCTTIMEHVRLFEDMEDPYLRERATDISDLGSRILMYLQSNQPVVPEITVPTVLVGDEVTVSHLAEVPVGYLVAIVSAKGSRASHVAILSHALGIPAVMGLENLPISQLKGKTMLVDGYSGVIHVNPSPPLQKEFRALIREQQKLVEELEPLIALPAETLDGKIIPLYVNTGLLADISPSIRSGAEGVGLYRTEIPFLVRDGFPGEDEQTDIYKQVLDGFLPRPVTFRTLDIGGDKNLSYFPIQESNPFLGWRGIRIMLDHPELFLTQLRAMLKASENRNNLKLMLPMISDVSEVDAAIGFIRKAYDELIDEGFNIAYPETGVMVEVPSAAYQINALSRRVDFFSIGSNDLTQYLLAVDRNNNQVAALYNSLHPAVIGSIKQIIQAAHTYQKPVSVCGEMAGDPASALLLIGLGVDSLSMSVGSLLKVKWVIRSFSLEKARYLADIALQMESASEIQTMLNDVLVEENLGGLVRSVH